MDNELMLQHNWDWDGRIDDPTDDQTYRIHQIIKPVSTDELNRQPNGIVILGYACDEGVRRNKGRVGASDGPNEIRKALGGMALHSNVPLYDLGDCTCPNENMEYTQANFANAITAALASNHIIIGIGGGHDIAYANGSGIYNYLDQTGPNRKLGIINLDTHLDLRAPKESTNSGTPFYQLAKEHANNFHYLAVGIQEYGNTKRLYTTAIETGTTIISRDDLQSNINSSIAQIQKFIEHVDHIYLTIDLDGLDSSICPGVSAPSVNGMTMAEVNLIIDTIFRSNKLLSMDIAELNPWYDKDHKTAKVAAYIIHRSLTQWM